MISKILVVGANGQLGMDCVRVLSNYYQTNGYSHEQLDICNPSKVQKILVDSQPDMIINCAAFTRVDDCETMTDHAFKINTEGPLVLAQNAKKIGAKLIHISTDYVFDGKRKIPEGYIESDSANPLSVYGKSKLAGEQAIMAEIEEYMIIRTAWLFGIEGNNFFKTIYKLATSDSIPLLNIIHTQYGSFTHTIDLVKQIHQLIQVDGQGIYHVTGEGYCSWYDGATYFLKAMGIKKEIKACTEKEFPTKAIRPKNSILINQRLTDQRMNMMPDWQDAIDHFVGIFKANLIDKHKGA